MSGQGRDYLSDAKSYCLEHIEGWKYVDPTTISGRQLTGNSNVVYFLETSEPVSPNKVIFRFFGPDEVTDKRRERLVFNKLSGLGLAPSNFSVDDRNRIEEFLDGFTPMDDRLMARPDIISLVMAKMRQFHQADLSDVVSKDPLITDYHADIWREISYNRMSGNQDITTRRELYSQAMELLRPENRDLYDSLLPRESPVVFCHCDPSELNFLYNPTTKQVFFVDYEFAGYSYRAMDLASYINEVMYDYNVDSYPFWRHHPENFPSDEVLKIFIQNYGEGREMFVELKRCLIATHYLWALWSLACYKGDTDGYDYLGYSLLRYADFKRSVEKFREEGSLEGLRAKALELFPN